MSCGNTFCAIQRWERLGLDVLLRRVAAHCDHRGRVVLAGGSAGAICRFAAGHSRSANPATFRSAMLQAAAAMTTASSAHAASSAKTKGTWSNIHVHGLGILPGLLCPHYNIAQGDRGARRGENFTELLLRHPTERGVALDQWAMLVLPKDGRYGVFRVPGHVHQAGVRGGRAGPVYGRPRQASAWSFLAEHHR